MSKKSILSYEIMPFIKERLDQGQMIDLTVSGHSMMPFYTHQKTIVSLKKDVTIKRFDVLLYHDQNAYRLHRVTSIKSDHYIIIGDASNQKEFINKDQILGVVIKHKKKKWVNHRQCMYLFKVFMWHILKPIRPILLKFIRRINHG